MQILPYRSLSQFREKFVSNFTRCGSWYPGHMYKGMFQMQAKLRAVDCILEVHDARIPFSGRNPNFYSKLTAIKPHILILNKCDLIDKSVRSKVEHCLLKENVQKVMFTNCKAMKSSGVDKIVSTAVEMIENSETFVPGKSESFHLMVIGIPNVGKSSLINKLRNIHLKKKKASSVGATPGITKSVLEKIKISDHPLIYLFDTPGIIEPTIKNLEVGLRLGLCRTLKDSLVGEELMSDYLLYLLNKQRNFRYVDYLKMKAATDDIRLLLLHIAKEQIMVQKHKTIHGSVTMVPDISHSAKYFISAFREGKFGNMLIDYDHIT